MSLLVLNMFYLPAISCSNFYYLWSGLDKLQAVPLMCMASLLQLRLDRIPYGLQFTVIGRIIKLFKPDEMIMVHGL